MTQPTVQTQDNTPDLEPAERARMLLAEQDEVVERLSRKLRKAKDEQASKVDPVKLAQDALDEAKAEQKARREELKAAERERG